MLIRCATRTMTAPLRLGLGLALLGAMAAGAAASLGIAGAVMAARRFREEREGWRAGAKDEPPPSYDAAPEAPSA